jgi:vancomycin resistance protein YoaR
MRIGNVMTGHGRRYRRKRSRLWVRAIVAFVLLATAVFTVDYLLNLNRIYDGISVNDLDVGGYRYARAVDKIQVVAANLLTTPVALIYKNRTWNLDPVVDMGATIDVGKTLKNAYGVGRRGNLVERLQGRLSARKEGTSVRLHVSLDRSALEKRLGDIAQAISVRPRNAALKGERFDFGADGVELDVDKTIARIQEGLERAGGNQIEIATLISRPDVTPEELLPKLGFGDVLGTYSTKIELTGDYADGKIHNIKLASDKINGRVIRPGGVFSFNGLVGNGIYKDGFTDGLIISDGKLIPFEGGGICQVSSTIYNAALVADAEIVRRYNHSIHVDQTSYVPLGLGASVFGEIGKDLKFKNTNRNPMLVYAAVEGDTLITTLYGRKDVDKVVEITTAEEEVIKAPVEEIKDPTLKAGEVKIVQKGYDGHKVKVYRTVKVGSEVIKRELISSDVYKASPTIVRVGKSTDGQKAAASSRL